MVSMPSARYPSQDTINRPRSRSGEAQEQHEHHLHVVGPDLMQHTRSHIRVMTRVVSRRNWRAACRSAEV